MGELEVLISIQPQHCENIVIGKKTIEIRKTRPKRKTPFKCGIYETSKKFKKGTGIFAYGIELQGTAQGRGKIIGEFVCDSIDTIAVYNEQIYAVEHFQKEILQQSCLTLEEIKAYLGTKNRGYAWHISGLKIYDKSKELRELYGITTPPQSWRYVNR